MVPIYGENEAEVIKTIIIMFFHNNIIKIEDLTLFLSEEEFTNEEIQ
jgi:hypothetical protein